MRPNTFHWHLLEAVADDTAAAAADGAGEAGADAVDAAAAADAAAEPDVQPEGSTAKGGLQVSA